MKEEMKHGWMKKGLVALCLTLLTAALLMSATAEAADMTGYSNDELVALLAQVQTEIVDRGIEKTAELQAGRYTGGVDVPAGKYVLLCKTLDGQFGIVELSAATDDPKQYPSLLYEFVDEEKEVDFYITIEEGGVLTIPFPCQLKISGGVMFK